MKIIMSNKGRAAEYLRGVEWVRGVECISRSVLLAAACATPALAVEVYYQPVVSLSAEEDSNLDLDPGVHQQVQGYTADVGTIVGIDTPDSTTTFRPRIVYRDYPEDSADDRAEAYLDFNSQLKTQRSAATLSGSLQHLEEFNAQFAPPTFNDINPAQPTPGNGRVVNGATQDVGLLAPKYVYSFTPVMSGGASGTYQYVKFSPTDDNGHLNFDYYTGRAFLNYSLTERTQLTFGALGSHFSTRDVHSESSGQGALADLTTSWTPLLLTVAEVTFQHTSLDSDIPKPIDYTVNKMGGSIDTSYKTELDRFRLIARRSILPSGGGAVYTTDRLQFQYDHTFTPRFAMTGAVSVIKTHGLTYTLDSDDRKFDQALVEAHYALTRYFFLQGGYQYSWQRYQQDTDSANNNRVYIQIGYKGLGQER